MKRNELKKALDAYFKEHEQDIIDDISRLIRIKSDKEPASDGKPYGEGPAACLAEAMKIFAEHGFSAKNYDNYVVTADMNDGPANLDILAHLDVVPADPETWTVTGPFEPLVKDGNLYGRGSCDDKGPGMAALWAMQAVKDLGLPVTKNCRLILGSDEECGSSDIEHYYKIEKEAPMTVSPDADWPIVNIEKGGVVGDIRATWEETRKTPRVTEIKCGQKVNIVPGTATCVILGMSPDALGSFMSAAKTVTGCEYFAEDIGNCYTKVTCKGRSCHASTPEIGNSACTGLLEFIDMLPLADVDSSDRIWALAHAFPHGDTNGETIGIKQADDISGEITVALTMLEVDETHLQAYFDSRCPICCTHDSTVTPAIEFLARHGLEMQDYPMRAPHHVPGDSDFVKTLLAAYTDVTGIPGVCKAIGGGTYVHHLEHGVAFGIDNEGVDTHMHGDDEFVVLENLFNACKIYALAIADLCK